MHNGMNVSPMSFNHAVARIHFDFHLTGESCAKEKENCIFFLSGVVGIVALSVDVIGYDDRLDHPSWCWVDPDRPDVLFWQYFTGKAWEIGAYVATAALYTLIKVFLVRQVCKFFPKSHLMLKALFTQTTEVLAIVTCAENGTYACLLTIEVFTQHTNKIKGLETNLCENLLSWPSCANCAMEMV